MDASPVRKPSLHWAVKKRGSMQCLPKASQRLLPWTECRLMPHGIISAFNALGSQLSASAQELTPWASASEKPFAFS